MNRFAITATGAGFIGAAAVAAALTPVAATGPTAVTLTGSSSMSDVLATMTSANDQIENLATQQIWGEKVFEHQQSIQDGWTAALNQLQDLQNQPLTGTDSVADAPSVLQANDGLNTALTNLLDVENTMPAIATSGTDATTELAQVPQLLFDQADMFAIDYTQVAPAALGDIFSTVTAGLDEIGSDLSEGLNGLGL